MRIKFTCRAASVIPLLLETPPSVIGAKTLGGGWNSWNIGVKSWEVKEQITKPIDDLPLYICGEAYSDYQGWVEGALQTADIMLAKFIK